jgi:hypothetical protein
MYTFEHYAVLKVLPQNRRYPIQFGRGPDQTVPIRQLVLTHRPYRFQYALLGEIIDSPRPHYSDASPPTLHTSLTVW